MAGNQIADSQFTSIYNQANRLAEVQQSGPVTVAQYLYNTEGQRVAKTVGAQVTHFVYGQEGQLLGVNDGANGSVIEEIVYLGTTPVATVRAGQVYFIHTDHLGTPRVVSDDAQQIVWRWDSDPFGEAAADEDPDGDSEAFEFGFRFRFPGQWFDAETGQHYNYFRDYEPSRGRYIESDPIGLDGGLNTYLYANANPVRFTDPSGENPLAGATWGGNIGTAIGAPLGGPIGGGIGRAVGSAIGAGIGYGIARMCSDDNEDDREERCDKQYYEVDIPTCRGISRSRGSAAARRCYASATERYAACLAGRPMPPLDTYNN